MSLLVCPEPLPRRRRPDPSATCNHTRSDAQVSLETECGMKHHPQDTRNGIRVAKPGDKNYGRVEDLDVFYMKEQDRLELRRFIAALPPKNGPSPIKRRAKETKEYETKSREQYQNLVKQLDRWSPGIHPDELSKENTVTTTLPAEEEAPVERNAPEATPAKAPETKLKGKKK
eukprot:CAMPEP_0196573240 /NCGR_PEP_ID=MMETSP1081-20130531/3172_1 /TAXON_ID=36882 /ORGANISM="Pyramimonas amylifera, Strain CCMP720" /LENGTH=172 /DNA_ID=CAMNT_0041890877 /DNA_START=115 /DNA_END=633 /DNA_ORIENTATION=-